MVVSENWQVSYIERACLEVLVGSTATHILLTKDWSSSLGESSPL